MVNKKQTLRIGTFLAILMFLLIPLLSSPVAASFTRNIGIGWTDNTPAGPTSGGAIAGGNQFDTTPFSARFSVSYNYRDSHPGPGGSTHQMWVTVSWVKADGTPGGGPTIYPQGLVTLAPGGFQGGTFATPFIPYTGKGCVFSVQVKVTCTDLNFPFGVSNWNSPTRTVTIV